MGIRAVEGNAYIYGTIHISGPHAYELSICQPPSSATPDIWTVIPVIVVVVVMVPVVVVSLAAHRLKGVSAFMIPGLQLEISSTMCVWLSRDHWLCELAKLHHSDQHSSL